MATNHAPPFACSSHGHHLIVRSSGSGHLNFFHKSLTKKSTRSARSVEAVFGPCCRGELHWPPMSNNVFPTPRAALASRHSGPRRRPNPTQLGPIDFFFSKSCLVQNMSNGCYSSRERAGSTSLATTDEPKLGVTRSKYLPIGPSFGSRPLIVIQI
jgi:hypothetical protein